MIKLFTYKEAKILIASYRERGFDPRFISGKSFDGKINSTGVIYFIDKKGRLYFLITPYNLNLELIRKQEINEGVIEKEEANHVKENPESLMIRKIKEESNLKVHLIDLEPLLKVVIDDNRPDFLGRKHIKFFYLIKSFSGDLINRDHDIFSDMKNLTPFFVPAALVATEIFGGHLDAYRIALTKLYRKMSYYDFGLSMNAYYRRKKSIRLEYQKNKKQKNKQNIAPGSRE